MMIGGDTLAGGGVLMALVYFLSTLALRTRDMDRERSKFATMAVQYAVEHEHRILAERDDAVKEVHRVWDELQERSSAHEAMLSEIMNLIRTVQEQTGHGR